MAYLFEINNKLVIPNTETLLISPFKEIWDRDKDPAKRDALEEMAFIEFCASVKNSNPYRNYPQNVKQEKITEEVITRKNWRPDHLIWKAVKKIEDFQKAASHSYSYYIAAKRAVEELQSFLETVDITERNKNDMPLYKPVDITKAIKETNSLLKHMQELEKRVQEELFEEVKRRADKKISIFADPESLKF